MVLSHANAPATERLCREARPFGNAKIYRYMAEVFFEIVHRHKMPSIKGDGLFSLTRERGIGKMGGNT